MSTRVNPHAEAFSANPQARTAVLLCHGFTGSTASMRPWAEALAERGLRVELPRLPGHGTHWRELAITEWSDWYACVERAWRILDAECDEVFVAGLSMGGALALRLAEQHEVAGVLLVNPAIASDDRSFAVLGLLKHVVGSIRAIGGDIALPGQDEHAYPRTPLAPAHSMTKLWAEVVRGLPRIGCDVLLMTSRTDHVVDAASARVLAAGLPRPEQQLERVELSNSLHVATLDHDAPLVHERSLAFIAAHGGQLAQVSR